MPPLSVTTNFLDLPILKSDQIAHAPFVVASSDPWPGPVAVYAADEGSDFDQIAMINRRATLGTTITNLCAGNHSRIQHGQSVDVTLASGRLSSVTRLQLLNGANTAAIGVAQRNQWEVVQFQSVELIGEQTYRLTNLIRGKFGSETEDHGGWISGADFVLLHAGMDQLPLSEENRTAERTFRYGPAGRSYGHASYRETSIDFSARGLRPLSPCHLNCKIHSDGWLVSWIRRGRIDADSWHGMDIPLGEESEEYKIRVKRGGEPVMELFANSQSVLISNADIAEHELDVLNHDITVEVSQVSNAYGAGSPATLII